MQLKLVDKIGNSKIGNKSYRWRHQPKFVATYRGLYDTAEILCCTAVVL